MNQTKTSGEAVALEAIQRWVQRAVIGLNLCPFAKGVEVKGQVHYAVSRANTTEELLSDLRQEIEGLLAIDSDIRDTSLLIVPGILGNFLDFNDFLTECDDLLCELDLDGVLQIASFHPDYQFAGTVFDDLGNYTNRAPYPTLHLLREDSIDRAVASFPDPHTIYENNIRKLGQLGKDGWVQLNVGPAVSGGDS